MAVKYKSGRSHSVWLDLASVPVPWYDFPVDINLLSVSDMKIYQINTTYGIGSTGVIVKQLSEASAASGHVCRCASGYQTSDPSIFTVQSHTEYLLSDFASVIFGNEGKTSISATERLIADIDTFRPDILHLHNIHGHYLHAGMLFDFIRSNRIRTVWTLHDCWPFTGRCPYFTLTNCDKWKSGCNHCAYSKKLYPKSLFDTSRSMWNFKRSCFSDVQDMTLVTPSRWLYGLVKESFLSGYGCEVIPNGIDSGIFYPGNEQRPENDSYTVLGVSFDWGFRKGLDVFIRLAGLLDDRFRIVLVGTDDEIDRSLPKNIISIHRTESRQQLADLYRSADVFVNPTREDNYPTVNLEALACGTPVITFDTGGSPEALRPETGIIVPCDDTTRLAEAIRSVCIDKTITKSACRTEYLRLDNRHCIDSYLTLYGKILYK